jgi:hypothetical protein
VSGLAGRMRAFPAARATWPALAAYCLLSFLFFGLRPLIEPGSQYIGVFDDPQIPIWSFAWWLHAIEHGDNPLVTHLIWAPSGVDLVWANTLPALAVVLAPLTAIDGAAASFDVAAVLLPAVSAWTGFLLCRRLTGELWPSLVGGYLFGFSSYELGHVLGQPQLTAVFVLPLVALVVLRALDGELGGNGLTLRIGLLLALQILLSLEIALTLTISLVLALAIGLLVAPARRPRLREALWPLVKGYLLGAVLTAPVLYYALTDLRVAGFTPPQVYTADLLNLVVPTHLEVSGAGWAQHVARHFPGNTSENGMFIGIPLLAIVVLFARRWWRTAGGRFLLVALAVATYLSFGPELTVGGHGIVPLPTLLGHNRMTFPVIGKKFLPLFDNILPVRFALYAALAGAVIVALWMRSYSGSRLVRIGLPALGVLLLVPNPGAGDWATTYSIPSFFTSSAYRGCLAPGEIVLPEPVGVGGQAMLWQVAAGFRFRMAGGRVQTSPPSPFLHPGTIAQISVGYPPVKDQSQLYRAYFRAKGVTSVIVDPRQRSIWTPSLDRVATPHELGGVVLYRVGAGASRPPASCPSA